MCGSASIRKGLSAPRLNLRASAASSAPAAHESESSQPPACPQAAGQALQAAWLAVARKIVAQTDDVGQNFASLARRMHHGEIEQRGIRGQATPQEAVELLEEGIAVLPLPLPPAAKETLQ